LGYGKVLDSNFENKRVEGTEGVWARRG